MGLDGQRQAGQGLSIPYWWREPSQYLPILTGTNSGLVQGSDSGGPSTSNYRARLHFQRLGDSLPRQVTRGHGSLSVLIVSGRITGRQGDVRFSIPKEANLGGWAAAIYASPDARGVAAENCGQVKPTDLHLRRLPLAHGPASWYPSTW